MATGPILTLQPTDTVFDSSANLQNVQLQCRADGDEPLTYRWTFNDVELSMATNSRLSISSTLTISDPERSGDEGLYVCYVSNGVGDVRSLPARLTIAYVESYSNPTETLNEVLTVDEGQCLSCNPPDHFPGIIASWTKMKSQIFTPISTNSRIRIMEDGRLCFAYALATDDGSYRCTVTSDIASDASSGGRISPETVVTTTTVSNPNTDVRIDEENKPKDASALVGESVTFECFFFGRTNDGNPPPIEWHRTGPVGASMPAQSSIQDNNQVLVIRDVQRDAAGSYQCRVGRIAAEATLTVKEPPVWVSMPHSAQKDIHTDLTWEVEAQSASGSITYTWYRNGEVLDDNLERHQFRNNYAVLEITDLEVDDSAMYQCFANNGIGTIYSAAQLTVRAFPPTFPGATVAEQPAPQNARVTVRCPVDGAPFPDVTWTHNDDPIEDSVHYNLTADPPHLVINNVQQSDGGTYTCQASNRYGSDEMSFTVAIKEATVITTPPENTKINVGESATLQCSARSDDVLELRYVWEFNGVQIEMVQNERFSMPERENGNLRIQDAKLHDAGEYTCIAMTIADRDSRTATVSIAGPPGPPSGLTVDINGLTASLEWVPGSPNESPITSYSIEAKTSYDDEWSVIRQVSSDNQGPAMVTGLEPYSNYSFRVFAVNQIGAGTPSSPVHADEMTAEAAPTTSPTNVGGGGGNEGDLRITWDTFPPSEWNAARVWYYVEWTQLQSEVPSEEMVDVSDATVYVATEGIELYTQYRVRVRAANSVDKGPWSDYVTIYSYQEAPKSAPTGLVVSGASGSSLFARWTGVDPDSFQGELVGYKFNYWTQEMEPENAPTAISKGQGVSATIRDLEPNTRYSVVVMAYSGGGEGPKSAVVTATTLKKSPQQSPIDVRLTADGNSITVEWRGITTSSAEENLQGYKIRYRQEGIYEDDAEVLTVQGASTTRATIKDLDTATTYLVTVQGYSAGGDGTISKPPEKVTTGNTRTGATGDRGSGTVQTLSLTLLLLTAVTHSIYHLL
ncbi:contactin-2-like [Diadema antillarum]|uniref:contactin-2-like n=1 Tax=Diadema antillarum TaxID=105358 RepID=UPI003A862287